MAGIYACHFLSVPVIVFYGSARHIIIDPKGYFLRDE